ncbi:ABC transporter ATP-binding protein [Taklimakanibacter lacteus]|uniref:ABC transporter ATP-binding protein n=1 Tax=Taklimakanibacter lacteus TaxID=2268456 RepID=UPI000E66F2E6
MTKPAAIPDISFRGVSKRYGDVVAVDKVDLDLSKGSFVSLLGPSGCGKTTCLRMMAGFEQPSAGEVFIRGDNVTGVPAYRRPVNMVFQHYALFPHLNVADNVSYGLRQRSPRPPREGIAKAVDEALSMVRLSGYGARRIWELSGGQQQRVALARALINRPAVLLLDEPLAALDRKLRHDMQIELQNLQRNVGITFLLVTHDQEEALSMSDRVCIMKDGRLVQAGTPRELYDEPVNGYVADFVGKSNFFAGTAGQASDGLIKVALVDGMKTAGRASRSTAPPRQGDAVLVSVRPERIRLAAAERDLPNQIAFRAEAKVLNRIFLGEQTEYLVAHDRLGEFMVRSPRQGNQARAFEIGDRVAIGWPPDAALVLIKD